MNAEEFQNPDTQDNNSPDEVPIFGRIKQVNVTMLDSESIISPPVAKDSRDFQPAEQNFPNSHSPKQDSEQPFIWKWMLFAGGTTVLLCASFLTALFFSFQEKPTVLQQAPAEASEFPSETQKSSEPQPVLETGNNTEIETRTESEVVKNPKENVIRNSTTAKLQDLEPDENTQAELNASLGNWVSATNERNVEQQMTYYAPQVNSFYRSRNTSINAVRDEKKRVFDGVDAVDIQTGKPKIVVSADGRTATMQFRKKYSIKKGQQNRNGEVIQELKWVKSKKGWRIISERDLKVIN